MNQRKNRANQILEEYFAGGLSPELRTIIQEWLTYETYAEDKEQALEEAWDRIVGFDQKPGESAYRSYSKIHKYLGFPIQKTKKTRLGRRIGLQVAAALIPLLLVAGVIGLWNMRDGSVDQPVLAFVTVTNFESQPRQVILPDSSEVWLNASTTLVYPEVFLENRQVTLEGEASFSVTRKSDFPFQVETEQLTITVLGTQFNVEAYPGQTTAAVTLYSGEVRLQTETLDRIMKPGEKAYLHRSSGTLSVDPTPEITPGWMDQGVTLQKTTLRAILSELERQHGIRFVIDSRVNLNQSFAFPLGGNEDIGAVMRLLQEASGDFTYTLDQHRITIEPINP